VQSRLAFAPSEFRFISIAARRSPVDSAFTDHVIQELAALGTAGSGQLPSFVADCLETLEEIQIRLKDNSSRSGRRPSLVPAVTRIHSGSKFFGNDVNAETPWRSEG